MATYTNLNDLFTAIADSIRLKDGSTDKIVADTFPDKIRNLRTGFDYDNQDVTEISDYEFYSCEDLNNVNCYNLTSVGASAFEDCVNLKSVVLYDGVENVGENAFKGCSGLTIYCEDENKPEGWHENWNPDDCEVVWGFAPVETWDISATSEDNVTAKLYNDVQNEGMYSLVISGSGFIEMFYGKTRVPWYSYVPNIISIMIQDGITSIGAFCFNSCPISYINIPDSVTAIGNSAFSGCEFLNSITIPSGITKINSDTFNSCLSLTSITIPDSVTSIGYNAFNDCYSLTSITIPDSVTSIDSYAFYDCTNLTSITIGNGVTSIGSYAIGDCSSLTSITYTSTISRWNAITFDNRWNYSTPDYIVHCTDGSIAKDGTIITT